jgi:phosphosulfolactate phosphohydrolase-like enzyme
MNNEPVAWTSQDVLDADHIIKAVVRREQDEQHTIPLYTHPVKELTDEEILELTKDSSVFEYREFDDDLVRFARAILKKAQE